MHTAHKRGKMSQKLVNKLAKKFEELTNIECKATYMEKGNNHNPTTLPKDKKGVYVFLVNDDTCLKVGKANSKSQARWNSHHYSLDGTTPSTLTKSILSHLDELKKYFNTTDIEEFIKILEKYNINHTTFKEDLKKLDKDRVKQLSEELKMKNWIQNNTHRIELLINNMNDDIDFDTNLLEALIQFELKPIFEGKNA